jgi:chromosome segregation ATPase
LKKEIKSLQEKLAAASAAPPVVVADPNAGEAKNAIRRQCLNMRNMTMRLRSDIVNVKLTSVQQINALMSQKDQLKKAFDQYVSLYAIKEAQYEAMEYSRDQLQERLDEAKQELRDGVNTMSQEHDKLKLKYKNARSELIDAQAEINRLKDEARAMDEKYKALSDAKAESDSHYNVSDDGISFTVRTFTKNVAAIFFTGFEQGVSRHAGANRESADRG